MNLLWILLLSAFLMALPLLHHYIERWMAKMADDRDPEIEPEPEEPKPMTVDPQLLEAVLEGIYRPPQEPRVRCRVCRRPLKDHKSRARGAGPVCQARMIQLGSEGRGESPALEAVNPP